MEFPDLVKKLEGQEIFTSWKKEHPKSFLAHVFVMIEGDASSGYQVGYYDTADKKVTSFLVQGDEVNVLPPSEIFKDPDTELIALDISGIELSTQDVLAKAHEIREDDYSGIPVMKVFFILQHIEGVGRVFNVTFVTRDLKTLNVKLEAQSGEVLKHSLQSLIQQDQGL